MKRLGSLLLCLLLSTNLLAQGTTNQVSKPPKPQLFLSLNNRTIDFGRQDVFASKTDTLMAWQGKITDAASKSYAPYVTIGEVVVSLVRDSRRVGFVSLANGTGSIASLAAQARSGDRYVIHLDKITTETWNGVKETIDLQPVYLVSIRL